MSASEYPTAFDPKRVGTFDAECDAGGGYVWDEVLEYRVWLHPEHGAPDEFKGENYFKAFATYEDALKFYESVDGIEGGAEQPLALILQKEHLNEPEAGVYEHVKEPRIAEWSVELLRRPKRTENTIPDFLSPDAPENRLDILRGTVSE